jgi:hypothetical protein
MHISLFKHSNSSFKIYRFLYLSTHLESSVLAGLAHDIVNVPYIIGIPWCTIKTSLYTTGNIVAPKCSSANSNDHIEVEREKFCTLLYTSSRRDKKFSLKKYRREVMVLI